MAYKPSYLQNSMMPTTANLMTARKKAENSKERNCRDFHAILQHIYDEDPEIESAANIRSVGISSFSWRITSHDGDDTETVQLANDRLRRAINKLIANSWEGSFYGVLAHRLIWKNQNGWVPEIEEMYDIDKINWHQNSELLEIYNPETEKYDSIPDTDRENWLLYSEGKAPGGALRKLILNRIIQLEMIREWANYNAQAKGVVTGQIPDVSNEKEIQAVSNAITDIYQRNFAIYGQGTEIAFKEMVAGGVYSSFKEIVDLLDSKCRIVLLGQANTSELPRGSGSRAALTVQKMITVDKLLADMLRVENIINEQLLPIYWKKNQGTEAMGIRFEFLWQEEIDPEKFVAVIDTLLNNGVPVRADDIYRVAGLRRPDGTPDVFMGVVNAGFNG